MPYLPTYLPTHPSSLHVLYTGLLLATEICYTLSYKNNVSYYICGYKNSRFFVNSRSPRI